MECDEEERTVQPDWKGSQILGSALGTSIHPLASRVSQEVGSRDIPMFIYPFRLEIALRDHMENPDFGLPYWDSTFDSLLPEPKDSIIFSEIFLGEVDDKGFVKNGPYHNWETMEGRAQIYRNFDEDESGEMLNDARVDWLINNPDINMILGATMPLTVSCEM